MTDHEPRLTLLGIYQAAAAQHIDTTGNDALIDNAALDDLHRAERDGLLTDEFPTTVELRDEWARQLWHKHAKTNGTRIKNQFLKGGSLQDALDLGIDFEVVVTICNADTLNQFYKNDEKFLHGRKVTLGALNYTDLLLMREQLRIAKAKLDAQWNHLDPMYRATADLLKNFADYRQFRQASDEGAA